MTSTPATKTSRLVHFLQKHVEVGGHHLRVGEALGYLACGLLLISPVSYPLLPGAPPLPLSALPYGLLLGMFLLTRPRGPLERFLIFYALLGLVLWCVKVIGGGFVGAGLGSLLATMQVFMFLPAVMVASFVPRKRADLLMLAMFCAGVAYALITLVQAGTSLVYVPEQLLGLPVYQGGNYYPAVLAIAGLLGCGWFWKLRGLRRWACGLGLAIILLTLLRLVSTTSALVATLGAGLVLLGRLSDNGRAMRFLICLTLVSLGVFAVVAPAKVPIIGKDLANGRIFNLHGRTGMWQAAADSLGDDPMTWLTGGHTIARATHKGARMALTDNNYMNVLAKQGLITFLLYVGFSLWIAGRSLRLIGAAVSARDYPALALAVTILLHITVAAQTTSICEQPLSAIPMWLLVGVMLRHPLLQPALGGTTAQAPTPEPSPEKGLTCESSTCTSTL